MANYAGVIEYIQLSLQDTLLIGTIDIPISPILFTWPDITTAGDVTIDISSGELKFNSPEVLIDSSILIFTVPVSEIAFSSPDYVINEYSGIFTVPVTESFFNSFYIDVNILEHSVIAPISAIFMNSPNILFDAYKATLLLSFAEIKFTSENVVPVVFSQPVINFGTALFIPISGIVFHSDINLFSFSEVTVATRMISNQFKYLVGTGEIDFSSDVFKIALMSSGFSFDQDTHGEWADVSSYEISSSGGYTLGGEELSIDSAWAQDNTNDQGTISWENHTFTPTGGSFDMISSAVIYDSSHSSNIIVGVIQFDSNISVVEGTVLELQSIGFNNI